MRAILILIVLAFLSSCQNAKEPLPSPNDANRIEGHWRSLTPTTPKWQYTFKDGFLVQKVDDFGVNITTQEYVYAIKSDSVFIAGSGGQRIWVVYFECDDVVQITEIEALLGAKRWLKRAQ